MQMINVISFLFKQITPLNMGSWKPRYMPHDLHFLLAVVKRKRVQFLKVQKLRKRHVQADGNMVQGLNTRVLGDPTHDVINCRLIEAAHACQLVICYASLLAEGSYALHNNF